MIYLIKEIKYKYILLVQIYIKKLKLIFLINKIKFDIYTITYKYYMKIQ